MMAFTVPQPNASLIAAGVQTILTDRESTEFRGRFAIASGETLPRHGLRVGPIRDAWTIRTAYSEPRMTHDDDRRSIPLPLGAIVATAELVDCVPIVRFNDERWAELVRTHAPCWVEHVVDQDPLPADAHGLFIADNEWGDYQARLSGRTITDQLPYGDFTCGRWAWLLADVRPVDPPIPAKGRQGWWRAEVDL